MRTESLPRPARIPPGLRRLRSTYRAGSTPVSRLLLRLRDDSQFLRTTVQAAFALLCVWIGVEFYFFYRWGVSAEGAPLSPRPPGAEGFLPISALISLKYFLLTGIINNIHPSGLFILLAILAVSLVLKKAFCSWLCPIGTLSESLWMLGRKLFGRNITLPRWLDYPLRSLKYLMMGFFVWSVATMDAAGLAGFIYSPYNKVADIKMYLFFAEIGGAALWTVTILVVFSVVIRNFWCRYLCPYGALLGIAGLLSPLKITRTASTCIDCNLCTKACPSGIKVHRLTRVRSDECTSCMACVEACPVKETLGVRAPLIRRAVPAWMFGALVAGIFVAVTGLGIMTGHWQNGISPAEYQRRIQQIDAPIYNHFRGHVPEYGPND